MQSQLSPHSVPRIKSLPASLSLSLPFTPSHLFRLKLLEDLSLQVLRLLGAGPATLYFSVLADEELLEVPLDALQAHQAGFLVLQPLEGRVCVVAVDLWVGGWWLVGAFGLVWFGLLW